MINRKYILSATILLAIVLSLEAFAAMKQPQAGPMAGLSLILGRPSDRSIAISVLSAAKSEVYVAWGTRPGDQIRKSSVVTLMPGLPEEISVEGLKPDCRYFYRLFVRTDGQQSFQPGEEYSFQTQRLPGSRFTFALQGDSHPERRGKMFDPDLYALTLKNVAKDRPDFYLTLGDDFSIERLIERQLLSQDNVDQVYALQRGFLGIVGASSPLFLVNGNHEQAARYLLDGTATNAAVFAARARNRFYPLPEPDRFYSGDKEKVQHIGLLRDYYSWTWGDALFVVIDPYWHSPGAVDNYAGKRSHGGNNGGKGKRDLWQITLGDEQYHWLEKTLGESRARWKFVFAHHLNGTGRGGIESADQYEWGGKDRRGRDLFSEKRPGWQLPIHQLMVKNGVTIFFQGHDHLYARQEMDGVIYQTTPNPADHTYQAFNREGYRSGDILENSGHLRVFVAPESVTVDYVRAFLPTDETRDKQNCMTGHSYIVTKGSGK